MAAALPFAGPALQAVGQIYGGVQEREAAYAQAAAADENARRTVLQGEYDTLAVRKDERMATGEMIAGQAGSGLELGSGSLADMIRQNALNRELDILGIRRKAGGEADALHEQARQTRKAGNAAFVGSLFSAVSTAIGGVNDERNRQRYEQAVLGGGTRAGSGGGDIVVRQRGRFQGAVPQMRVTGGAW